MTFRKALGKAGTAARENLFPGLLLQALMLIFLALYLWNEPTKRILADVAQIKSQWGYVFAFFSYLVAGALLPELLRIAFFQRGRATGKNLWNFLTAAPFWGGTGILVDAFYHLQTAWFGPGDDLRTVLTKMAVDQFIFSPFVADPLIVFYLHWRDERYRWRAFVEMFRKDFLLENLFPLVVAGWCIWIPGVSLVYFMPPLLQLPVAVLIQVFWVLIITTVSELRSRPPGPPVPQALT